MASHDLLPCPFCAAEMIPFVDGWLHPVGRNCVLNAKTVPLSKADLWNTRAAETELTTRGFDAAVEAIETWANGFYSVRTAKYLRSTAADLRRERDNILAALSSTGGSGTVARP